MKKEKKAAKKAGWLDLLMQMAVSSIWAAAGAGILAVVLALAAIYLLHPYLSILALIALAAFFYQSSENALQGSVQKTVAASFAVAIFLMLFAVPSGELGNAKCPEKTVNGGPMPVRLKYFTSPFCIECILFDKNVEEAQKISSGFTVDYFDIRYCKRQADSFGFPGTPCYAFFGPGGLSIKRCGVMTAGEIVQMASGIS